MDSNHVTGGEDGLSRRNMLKVMGIGAGIVGAHLGGLGEVEAHAAAPATPAIPPTAATTAAAPAVKVAPKAMPFDMTDVKLLESEFLHAQKMDEAYLLALEPDRMLHNFHVNAGLPPKAAIYGGWESASTWADIRCHGHTLGHYLTACALMYATTGDAKFKERVDYIIKELQACQEAGKTGLVCAFPEGGAIFDAAVAGRRFTGVPWYTMQKIYAGLRDAYLYTASKPALDVLIKLTNWAVKITEGMTDAGFQRMLGTEHGGMNEVIADVYDLTGDAKHLALARRFCHQTLLGPLSQSRDTLSGMHANTQVPKVVGFQRLYEVTGQKDYQAASAFFFDTVVNTRSFVTGGHGDGEHFFPPAEFPRHAESAKNMETCCTHNMLKLARALFLMDPTATYADYYERALYNGILSSQDPDSGMVTYFQGTRPGYMKLYCRPTESFWCCTGTGIENHAKYNDSIYFHDAEGVFVNLFIPSTLNWKAKNARLTQTTRFPNEAQTRLQWTAAPAGESTLKLRHPGWCKTMTVRLNGAPLATSEKPGSYLPLRRTWQTGDVVEIDLPMTLKTVALPGLPETISFVYGPIVLAGALGNEGIAPGADLIVNERTIGNVLNRAFAVPTLTGDPAKVLASVKPVADKPLTFTTTGVGRPNDVQLIPYYRIAHQRYSIYWKLGSA